ncbi:MAG: hypothetical protein ACR2JB_03700 [Bryobacteraceae bacterium]
MLSAIQTKLLIVIVALLVGIASYFGYQKHEHDLEQRKVSRPLRPDEKKALDATTNWAEPIHKQRLK